MTWPHYSDSPRVLAAAPREAALGGKAERDDEGSIDGRLCARCYAVGHRMERMVAVCIRVSSNVFPMVTTDSRRGQLRKWAGIILGERARRGEGDIKTSKRTAHARVGPGRFRGRDCDRRERGKGVDSSLPHETVNLLSTVAERASPGSVSTEERRALALDFIPPLELPTHPLATRPSCRCAAVTAR